MEIRIDIKQYNVRMVFVSIIVPCFKRVEQTVKALKLLKASLVFSGLKGEILVSDNSPDTLLEKRIKQEFKKEIIYLRCLEKGIAANKNNGASVAQGNILIFCDTDIEVRKDTISQTILALKKTPSYAMVGGKVIWSSGEIDRPKSEDRIHTLNGSSYIEVLYSRYIATYTEVFKAVGMYDTVLFNMRGEGADLSTAYWRQGYPLGYRDDIVVTHVVGTDSSAIRIPHIEYALAKDFFLLACKYNMFDTEYPHFLKTVNAYFSQFGDAASSKMLRGIGVYREDIEKALRNFSSQKYKKPVYDFRFLEVFSDKALLKKCIHEAEKRLVPVWENVFTL